MATVRAHYVYARTPHTSASVYERVCLCAGGGGGGERNVGQVSLIDCQFHEISKFKFMIFHTREKNEHQQMRMF